MKNLLTTILLLLCLHTAYAQEPAMLWMKGIGGTGVDQIWSFETNTPNKYTLKLESNSAIGTEGNIDSICNVDSRRKIFFSYDDVTGDIDFLKCFGVSLGDSFIDYYYAYPDGTYIVGGSFKTGWGFLIEKHDHDDNIIWKRQYSRGNGGILRSMLPAIDGGYYMLGESYYVDTNVLIHYGGWSEADLWLLKVDSNGDKDWSIVIGGSGEDNAGRLVPAPGGGCYVVGYSESYDYDCVGNHSWGDAFGARVDKDGHIIWSKCLGGSGTDRGTSGCGNGSGGLLMGGYSASADGDVHHNHGSSDFWAVNMDSTGNIIWENSYGRPGGTEYGYDICRNNDGSIWMTGKGTGSGFPDIEDAFLVHLKHDGSFLSDRKLGSSSDDRGTAICPLMNGSTLVAGRYGANNGAYSSLPKFGAENTPDVYYSVFASWTTKTPIIAQSALLAYPNPAHNTLYLSEAGLAISIFDVFGRVVHSSTSSDAQIDISSWPPGIYYIQAGTYRTHVVVY